MTGNPIYLIGGSKGGVGKSIVSIALIDYLEAKKEPTILLESDTSNPDVFKIYQNQIRSFLVNLDEIDGWIDLVNYCDKSPESTIVINTAARNQDGVKAYGETLCNTLGDLKRELITLWVINRQRDSLELLKKYRTAVPVGLLHVLQNKYFGEEKKFERYHRSNLKQQIEDNGGKSLLFPDLADRVSDDLYGDRLSISTALKELPLGNRAELIRWRNASHKMFSEVVQ